MSRKSPTSQVAKAMQNKNMVTYTFLGSTRWQGAHLPKMLMLSVGENLGSRFTCVLLVVK